MMAKLLRWCATVPTECYWGLRARFQFLIRGVKWPQNLQVRGKLGLSSGGVVKIGQNVRIVNDSRFNRAGINHPTQLVAAPGAVLMIGDNVGISGASIYSVNSISIGNFALLGVNCHIYDHDFHPLNFLDRRNSGHCKSEPIVIEDDVWLCANVTVLKGITIGARSVIAAGSIVTSDIPSDSLAGGVPAKVIRCLKKENSSEP